MKKEKLLLTQKQLNNCVLEVSGEFPNRYRLHRIICRAQVEKMVKAGAVMLAKDQRWPDDPVTDAMIDDIETGDIYAAQSNGWQHCQSAAIAVGFRRVEDIE